jgi:N-acetylmuramoyl-L-alanine amidase
VLLRAAAGREAVLVNGAQAEAVPLAGGTAGSDGRFRTGSGDPYLWSTDVPASWLGQPAALVVTRGADSVRLALPRVSAVDSAGPRFARVGIIQGPLPDTDRTIIARPVPNGTYKWFLLPGTVAELTARAGDFARIRLDDALDVWVDANDVGVLPPGYPAPRRVAANARVVNAASGEWSEVIVPIGERPAYQVEELDDAVAVTLYDTQANTDIVNYAAGAGEVRRVTWEQVSNDRARFTIALRHAPYGYFVRWDRGNFIIRVRRPPVVDKSKPLEGLRIAVDAGHPPAGSTGPTGLYEAVATLAIAERVKTYLEVRGATVIMTRTAPGAVALGDRPVMARHADAQAFVSIHLNALPDGVNPMTAHGTGTYYFNARSEPLAREVQHSLVRHLGLRDLGINYDNLAVLRPTWMPSILCEGAFIIIPEQEAALRTPEFQDRYAKGVVEGLESYFLRFAR